MGESHDKPEFPPLLEPGFHPMTLVEVRRQYVTAFEGSVSRRGIFEGFERILSKLIDEGVECEVWIDGSFVTEKINPEDVDILIRFSARTYDRDARKKAVIDWAVSPDRWASHSCDSFRWLECQMGEVGYDDSEEDRKYWTEQYGLSRKKVRKGICVLRVPLGVI